MMLRRIPPWLTLLLGYLSIMVCELVFTAYISQSNDPIARALSSWYVYRYPNGKISFTLIITSFVLPIIALAVFARYVLKDSTFKRMIVSMALLALGMVGIQMVNRRMILGPHEWWPSSPSGVGAFFISWIFSFLVLMTVFSSGKDMVKRRKYPH